MSKKSNKKRKRLSLFRILFLIILILSIFKVRHIFRSNPDEILNTQESDDTNLSNNEKKEDFEEVIEKKTTATIIATGDIMFHSPQIKAAYDSATDTYDFSNSFKYVKKYIEAADLSLGNFETVTAGPEKGFSGYPNFNSPFETLEALKNAGFDVLTTANNHCLDQRAEGLKSTIDAIEDHGMKNVGTYKEANNSVLIENVNDISIAILSYTYGCNGMEHTLTSEELDYMVNLIDEDKIKDDIEEAKEKNADLIIVFIHWGNEYQRDPSQEQIELGNKMAEWGVDIILGSHPHVIQHSEMINKNGKDSFIIYSMGNFLSNQRRESINNKYTEDGVIVQLEVEKDHNNNNTVIKEVDYIPTWVHKFTVDGRLYYEILPVEDVLRDRENYDTITEETFTKIEESFNDTMEKLGD